jgi:hypothetical protein
VIPTTDDTGFSRAGERPSVHLVDLTQQVDALCGLATRSATGILERCLELNHVMMFVPDPDAIEPAWLPAAHSNTTVSSMLWGRADSTVCDVVPV